MRTRMRVGCFELTLKTIDRLVKVVFPQVRNPKEEIDLRILRVVGQYMLVDALRGGVVSGLFFAARLFEQHLHVALRLRCPGRCRGDRAESSEQKVVYNPAPCAMPSEGRARY